MPWRWPSFRSFSSAIHRPLSTAIGVEAPSAAHQLSLLLSRCSGFPQICSVHGFMVSRGLDQDNRLLNVFLNGCTATGFTTYAFSVFSLKERPDIHLCNTVIRALAQTDSANSAIDVFRKLHFLHLRPDNYSYPFALKAAAHLSATDLGREIHAQIIHTGHCGDIHVSTALINLYCLSALNDARLLFDEMPHRAIIAWNALTAGYARQGDMVNAVALFEQMPERNVISWTTIISGYVQIGSPAKAMEIFRQMQTKDNVQPDEVALLSALSACAHLGALQTGEWIHRYILSRNLEKPIPLMNSLIDMYAKSGNIPKALEVFEGMRQRNVVTWTTLISGMALHGLATEALQMFRRMEEEHVSPNDVTFVAVLSACSHAGFVSLGRALFSEMRSIYHIRPRIEHYGCMVDLLGRTGLVREAKELLEEMPFEANGAIWGSLMAAARRSGDAELGDFAMGKLLELEPHNSANHSMLSDIYSSMGRWGDAARLRMMIRDYGVKKTPGGSSLEVGGEIHEFISCDSSHPRLGEILETIISIHAHSKMMQKVKYLQVKNRFFK